MHHSDLCEWSDSAFFTSATSSFTVVSTFSLWAQRVCGGGRECGATKAESNQTHTHINTHTHTHIAEVQSMRRLQGQDCGRKRSVDVAVFFFFFALHCFTTLGEGQRSTVTSQGATVFWHSKDRLRRSVSGELDSSGLSCPSNWTVWKAAGREIRSTGL